MDDGFLSTCVSDDTSDRSPLQRHFEESKNIYDMDARYHNQHRGSHRESDPIDYGRIVTDTGSGFSGDML